jgi:spore coat polysaccharide biosynthesis protein SpsF (cytidylyltransferase family)
MRGEFQDYMKNMLIIQARTGSSRMPDKVLNKLCGKPMLQHIVERTMQSRNIDYVMVATTIKEEDGRIEKVCKKIGVDCYRGAEDDVLDRYYQAAKKYYPQNIVRITADCPLADPVLIDEIIDIHVNGNYDYTSNTLAETYPDGLDVEVFTFSALKEAWKNAKLASEREHVTPYIKYKGNFKRFSVELSPSLADKRWTVDTQRDFEMVKQIYHALYREDKVFLMNDVLRYLKENHGIEEINAGITRNEGYLKSIANDYVIKGVV